MNVLHVVAAPVLGGAQDVVRVLVEDQRGCGIGVVAATSPGGQFPARLRSLNVEVLEIPLEHGFSPSSVAALRRFLSRELVEIVHAHGARATLYSAVAAWGKSVRLISHVHLADEWRWNGSWRARMDRTISRRASRIIACSTKLRDDLVHRQGFDAARVRSIPNGVEVHRFDRLPGRSEARAALQLPIAATIAGCAVRLEPQKGIAHLLDAFALVAPESPELHLAIAGAGSLRGPLETQACSLGLADRVHWLGWQDDVGHFLAALDLYVLPSLEEGLPLGVLEAMAAGVPVLATAVGGTPDVVQPGVTGALVPPAAPASLAASLMESLRHRSQTVAMAQRAREFVLRHHSAKSMCEAVRALYHEVLGP